MWYFSSLKHDYNEDHRSRNDHLYTTHRKGLWDKLEPLKSKFYMIMISKPFEEYISDIVKTTPNIYHW